ncbi:50S ribosomal protein L11 methyltransferase [Aerosticca soli]|uniref:Ribosomal protein L11 methyltransferase n=1 Tax=Aerosticca soli TaxID=2010829 RepID=A0A2Z6E2P8_9GAMM|nr:50S ribosomal protein L11 methyltransferase [Aerosticca soli]MDI3262538.1 50S ribosomal protein L11 methyltransferase [Fulvimonas sp.]BBD78808.1 ribosomal protein L11 methyltransferase [Aerosticca soli]
MPFLQLSLTIPLERQPETEAALEDLGALSVSLRDADAETPDEQAIFEPGVGELPLWSSLVVEALFEADADRRGLLAALHELLPWLDGAQLALAELADADWERAWMDQYRPMPFGRRLWIYPWNVEPPVDEAAVVVRLDPGLAFGSGTHPTTALCLEWLDAQALAGKTLIDYGCGSGILAIAALKLGAARAVGIDNDPQALVASADNAARNGVADRLQLYPPEAVPEPLQGDALVANILAAPLHALAPRFAQVLRPGAPIALSGILRGQEEELVQRYGTWFDALAVDVREDWVRIAGRRR